MSRLRIAMVTTDYLPNIGGIAAHVFHLSQALTELGHQVAVINPRPGRTWQTEVRREGVTTYRIFHPDSRLWPVRAYMRMRAVTAGVKSLIREWDGLDVIHQHDYMYSTFGVKRFTDYLPWVWTNHSSTFLMDIRSQKRYLVKKVHDRVDTVIAVSREIENISRELWPGKDVLYIPNGVDTSMFNRNVRGDRSRFGLDKDDFVILCPRRMVPKNGVIYLARAVTHVLAKRPRVRWRFVFVGCGPADNPDKDYLREVQAILTEAAESGYVKYLAGVPHHNMPELNAIADVVVIPSLIEAVSLSALEAMASGKPVIATSVGGLPEVVKDGQTGLLVPPRNPRALAEAILRLQGDSVLARDLARAGEVLATNNYSWTSVAQQTEKVYQRVVERSACRTEPNRPGRGER